MFIKLLVRQLCGYVRIEVEGYYIERFINICTNNKILIWNLKREKGVKLYLNIGINDFKKLSMVAKKTNCKVKILKKRGIPFLVHRYKKRKIFVIFLILILLTIFISSKYVWNVDISIKDNLKLDNIEEDIKLLGISKGVKKDEINTDEIINELRLKRDDIAWVGIDIEGTTVKINIVKADKAPNIIDSSDYCNIVANKAGVIQKIIAQNGTAVVNVGDTVQKGDVLIEGYMEGKYTDTRYVHSLGEVEAIVSYQKSKEIKFNQVLYNYTGKEENKYELKFNNFTFKLYKSKSKFEEYDTQSKEEKIKIFGNLYLPFSINKINNREQIKEEKNYSKEDAILIGTEEMSPEIEKEIGENKNIINKNVDINEHDDGVIVTVIYEALENIGIEQK